MRRQSDSTVGLQLMRPPLHLLLGLLAGTTGLTVPSAAGAGRPREVVVIPITDAIAEPQLYILRRGLKDAVARHADAVVLDLKTPGGAIDVTFDMLAALNKFPGQTIAYVDDEAMSAGALIAAACGEIWFSPDGVMGAAAPVTETGQDIEPTMKQKLVSYLKARMRAVTQDKGYRGEVVGAMIDADTELTIDGQVIKRKGELLSLTATEAMRAYGHPPRPLLAAGIASDVDALLARKFGRGATEIRVFQVSWSERLAVRLNQAAPVLLGLGLLGIFVAFKTQGFGGIGIASIALLALVFLGGHVAGLSGHEPAAVFALGVVLVLLEVIFFHSAGLLGVVGLVVMAGSIVWGLADLWPNEPLPVAWSSDAFVRPFGDLGLGLVIAAVLAALLARFLPRGWMLDRLVVGSVVGGSAQAAGASPAEARGLDALIGRRAVAATALRPAGQVEIDGRRYEAKVEVGAIDAGAPVLVRGRNDFGLIVERAAP